MKIILSCTSLNSWIGELEGSKDIEPIKTVDREETLLRILADMGIEVIQQGEWYDFGVKKSWRVSNMDKESS